MVINAHLQIKAIYVNSDRLKGSSLFRGSTAVMSSNYFEDFNNGKTLEYS